MLIYNMIGIHYRKGKKKKNTCKHLANKAEMFRHFVLECKFFF